MSLWEFRATIGGWAQAQGGGEAGLPKEDTDRLASKLKSLRPELTLH
jgi:hypothetical protein